MVPCFLSIMQLPTFPDRTGHIFAILIEVDLSFPEAMLKCIDPPLVVGCSLGHKYSIVSKPMECKLSPHFSPFVSHYRPINIDQRVTLHCINYKP